jgi:hypothetical protein
MGRVSPRPFTEAQEREAFMQATQPIGVHLVGSIPLTDAEQVFTTISEHLGDRVKRIPDGETGSRSGWSVWQRDVLSEHPDIELIAPGEDPVRPHLTIESTLKVRDGVNPADVHFGSLGYAKAATESYKVFAALRARGIIPDHARLLVAVATPFITPYAFFPQDFEAIAPRYEAAMRDELAAIVAAIPADDLAIQIDGVEPLYWDEDPFPNARESMIDRIARVVVDIPDEVELGIHLCYGDFKHQHRKQPRDLAFCVEIANALAAAISHPLQWVHVPVPIERDDDEYFAPLDDLRLDPDTELYLGLIHIRDGVDGAQRRIEAAQKVVSAFGIATECGMGRRPPERGGSDDTFVELLGIHASVSAPIVAMS